MEVTITIGFQKDFVEDYLSNIIEAKVNYISGFRSPPKDNFMGPYLYSTDRFINSLKILIQLN